MSVKYVNIINNLTFVFINMEFPLRPGSGPERTAERKNKITKFLKIVGKMLHLDFDNLVIPDNCQFIDLLPEIIIALKNSKHELKIADDVKIQNIHLGNQFLFIPILELVIRKYVPQTTVFEDYGKDLNLEALFNLLVESDENLVNNLLEAVEAIRKIKSIAVNSYSN